MVSPATTLPISTAPAAVVRHWGDAASSVLEVLDTELRGTVRVLGGPGTGKSSLLLDVAAVRIAAGADPESVLLLTGSGRLGARTRSALTTELLAAHSTEPCRAVVRQPLVRSVHAFAFAVLRLAAQRAGDPPPRLITGAEQDGIIRELLAGDIEDGALSWPPELRAALGTAGFATELRDLLARCAERGVDPLQLQHLGRLAARPVWTAAGRFAQQYEQVMLLRAAVGMAAPQATVPALGAAELVGAALEAFATDPDLLAAEHNRISLLLVDDAQHLDPQAARLVRILATGVATAVIAGDPHQTVFGFRGADPALLLGDSSPSIMLDTTQRCSPAIAQAITGVLGQLPGSASGREIVSAKADSGAVEALLAASEHAEAALISDCLRRAHLVDGVPWSQMAVIVRSVHRAAAGLPRALAGAGVPVAPSSTHGPLLDNAAVRALLTVLTATASGLTGEHALALLTGPIGRVDPVSLRQLRRSLRRLDGAGPPREFGELLVAALRTGLPDALAPSHARPLRRISAVLGATAAAGPDPRSVLWQAWQRSSLARRLLTTSERSGPAGLRAAADLDAVTALFDIADQFVSRTAGASLSGLVDHIAGLQLPAAATEPVELPEGVAIVSPHQALDRDWDVVVIAGLQEGLWPNTVPRGGVLGTQRLLDVLDGITGDVSLTAPLVAEERRLLIAAMGRARARLVVTAVDGAAGDTDDLAVPSPFFHDIARFATKEGRPIQGPLPVVAPRVLSVPAVVGKLRGVVCAPDGAVDDAARACAAAQLARLAGAGVPGADPAGWYANVAVSTDAPLWDNDGADHIVTVSPSTLQTLQECPLRWLMECHGGADARELRSTVGSLVHALISQTDKTEAQLMTQLDALWRQLPFESEWFANNELTRHQVMLATFAQWREQSRRELTEVGTEVEVDGVIGGEAGDGPGVRVRGRVDRLERDVAGGLVIVDVKTGKSPVSKDDAQRHAQLAMYQLAVAEGLLPQGDQPGGGRLVYVAKTGAGGATERAQDALTPDALDGWRTEVQRAAAATAGPRFVARRNDGCAHCPVRPSCPAHTGPTTQQMQ
jgi:superfamily I DNA/RNA helicase/RecB family exonuclease